MEETKRAESAREVCLINGMHLRRNHCISEIGPMEMRRELQKQHWSPSRMSTVAPALHSVSSWFACMLRRLSCTLDRKYGDTLHIVCRWPSYRVIVSNRTTESTEPAAKVLWKMGDASKSKEDKSDGIQQWTQKNEVTNNGSTVRNNWKLCLHSRT